MTAGALAPDCPTPWHCVKRSTRFLLRDSEGGRRERETLTYSIHSFVPHEQAGDCNVKDGSGGGSGRAQLRSHIRWPVSLSPRLTYSLLRTSDFCASAAMSSADGYSSIAHRVIAESGAACRTAAIEPRRDASSQRKCYGQDAREGTVRHSSGSH